MRSSWGNARSTPKSATAFVQRTRRTIERRDRKLDQAALAILPLVVDALNVMAGIAFVAAELDRAVYEDGQIGVDLDQTLIAALIPIGGAPAVACHKLHLEVLVGRQSYMSERAPAALGDGDAHDGVESIAWNHIPIAKRFYPLG